jgi:hypothetical protein
MSSRVVARFRTSPMVAKLVSRIAAAHASRIGT